MEESGVLWKSNSMCFPDTPAPIHILSIPSKVLHEQLVVANNVDTAANLTNLQQTLQEYHIVERALDVLKSSHSLNTSQQAQ